MTDFFTKKIVSYYILFSLHHVIECQVYYRKCKRCFLIFFEDTLNIYGLLNVGGVYLISYDLFYMMENMIKRGLPVRTSASTVIDDICDRTSFFGARKR